MIKGKSKFDYEVFYGDGGTWIAFSKQRYTKEQAIELWEMETELTFDNNCHVVYEKFTRYRFGINQDDEPISGWFLEQEDYGNKSVPVWAILRVQYL